MTREQLEMLNEIRVKMFYDPKKTLSEQNSNFDFEKDFEGTEIFPIPGYKAFPIPKINDPEGGYAYFYLPIESENTIEKFLFPECKDFVTGVDFCSKYNLTTEDIQRVVPRNTVKQFVIGDDLYRATIGYRVSKRELVFAGYVNANNEFYKTPNPDDFKNAWEKFLDDYGTGFQIAGSLLALAVVSYFTGGMGLPLAYRLGLEILVELAVNVPVALYDYKKGNTASGNLSLLFSLLPLIQLPALQGVSKETLESISQKLAQVNIETGADLAKFYDDKLNEIEKYAFSRVMKQNPNALKELVDNRLKSIILEATKDTSYLKRILFKDRNWWKNLGVQFPAVMAGVFAKKYLGDDFTETELERIKNYLEIYEKKVGETQANQSYEAMIDDEELGREVMEEVVGGNPEKADSLLMGGIVKD